MSPNDPFDENARVKLITESVLGSRSYMEAIRSFTVREDSLAIWFFGQNGFILKAADAPLIGVDLYLTDSCAARRSGLPFRVDRQLPVFIEPEDLDVDIFFTTHAHSDHADPDTIRRFGAREQAIFV